MISRRSFVARLVRLRPPLRSHNRLLRSMPATTDPVYSNLTDPNVKAAPLETMKLQQVFDSAGAEGGTAGPLGQQGAAALPRSEMAWATTLNNQMHVVGGYGEQRVDRPYHHVYDQASGQVAECAFPAPRRQPCRRRGRERTSCMPSAASSNRTASRTICASYSKGEAWRPIAPLRKALCRHRLRGGERHHLCDRRRRRRHLRHQEIRGLASRW